jgi:hypothetical protein
MAGNRPTLFELIEAVCEFLENKIIPKVDSYTAFHARVAINTLGIVKREIELGSELNAEEHKRLSRLLKQDGHLDELNSLLCQKIRDGSIDYSDPDLIDHLLKTTMGKLSVDNPDYSAYKQTLSRKGKI